MSGFHHAARQTASCASHRIILFSGCLPLAAALFIFGSGHPDQAAPAAAKAPASSVVSVLVTLKGPLTPAHAAKLRALGADVYRNFPMIHALALRLPSSKLAALKALPWVSHVSPDSAVDKTDEFTVGSSEADQAYSSGLSSRPLKLTGLGVGVAVLDSGVTLDRDLRGSGSSVVARVSFVPGGSPDDACGHGTHVAGIIAGSGDSSTGVRFFRTFKGIAPQARLVSVRVLNAQGQGDVSTVLAGIQWVVTNKARYNIRVLNLSLGHPIGESCRTDPLCLAAEVAWKSGIVVVCAAGNGGRAQTTPSALRDNEGYGTAYGTIGSPGNDPCVITVGASKRALLADNVTTDPNRIHDKIATYSSRGPSRLDFVLKPDLVAPGNRIVSLNVNDSALETAFGATNHVPRSFYTLGPVSSISNTYFCLSGTSMAAPVVSGAVALLLQAAPGLSPDTIKARLMVSADKMVRPDGLPDPCTYGAGYLNIPAALACPLVFRQSALSPTLSLDSQGNAYLNPLHMTWGSGLAGATHITWGDSLGLGDIWGPGFLGGANILASSPLLVGQSVWSDPGVTDATTAAADISRTTISGEN